RWHALSLTLAAWCAVEATLGAQEPRQRSDAIEQQRPTESASPLPGEASDPGACQFSTDGRYRITPGDVLALTFPLVPEFDQVVTVQPDGYVNLLSVGDLRVQGRTVRELRAALVETDEPILLDARITV